jgi:hypothetical protein
LKPAAAKWRAAFFAARDSRAMPELPPESAVHLKAWNFANASEARNAGYRRIGDEYVRIDLAERVIKKAHEARGQGNLVSMDMAFATSLGIGEAGLKHLTRWPTQRRVLRATLRQLPNPKIFNPMLLANKRRSPPNLPLPLHPNRKPSHSHTGAGSACQSRVRPNSVNSVLSHNIRKYTLQVSRRPSQIARLLRQSKMPSHHPWRCSWRRLRVLSSRRSGRLCGSTSFFSFCALPRAERLPKAGPRWGISASMVAGLKRQACRS